MSVFIIIIVVVVGLVPCASLSIQFNH